MNITDEDQMTPSEYDQKRKKEKQAYKDKQFIYSEQDMINFGNYCLANRGLKLSTRSFLREYLNKLPS